MSLQKRRRIAGDVLGCSPKRVRFATDRLEDIKNAITKADIRILIREKAIRELPEKGVSRGRARHIHKQKVKGLRKGKGSRKGKATARAPAKLTWMNKIRAQRKLLKELREQEAITKEVYRQIYRKAGGGFFRSRGHIKLYLEDQNLLKK